MGRRKGIMSEGLKEELAKELGFYDVVQKEAGAVFVQETQGIWSKGQ